MNTYSVTESHLRSIYEVLCGTSYWLSAQTSEGKQVRDAAINQLRRLEDLLELPEEERLRIEVVPSDHGKGFDAGRREAARRDQIFMTHLQSTFPIMKLCPICGNKRCPKAQDAKYKCTGSNELNQIPELEEN